MKKMLLATLFALALLMMPARAGAHQYDSNDSDYPLRYIAYVVHPVGVAIEYGLLRPIHWLVSQPNLDKVFGHEPCEPESYNYFEWK